MQLKQRLKITQNIEFHILIEEAHGSKLGLILTCPPEVSRIFPPESTVLVSEHRSSSSCPTDRP